MHSFIFRLVLAWLNTLTDHQRTQIRDALAPSDAEQRAIALRKHRQLWERAHWAAR